MPLTSPVPQLFLYSKSVVFLNNTGYVTWYEASKKGTHINIHSHRFIMSSSCATVPYPNVNDTLHRSFLAPPRCRKLLSFLKPGELGIHFFYVRKIDDVL